MDYKATEERAKMLAKIETINRVDGFDPSPFAVDYVDLNTQETRKRLPVMIQMAWFRLKYPEGRIAVQVTAGKDCFIANARIYPNFRDPVDYYLAEATASAVERIPDAHCNGDMHAALDYAAKVKHEQRDFLAKQGIMQLYE